MAVLLTSWLTSSARGCYRAGLHMRMSFSPRCCAALAARHCARRRVADGDDRAVHDQLGAKLVRRDMQNSIADFPSLSVA